MSTNLFIPSSNISKKPVLLPWEMIGHIFSFCDQPRLVAVSLVSFGCWELAGPILAEKVEIVDMDGLASLFFIDVVPSSPRLQQTTSLLSRIRTLTLRVEEGYQSTQSYIFGPALWEGTHDDGAVEPLLPPLRLLAFTNEPLPLRHLFLPCWNWASPSSLRLQDSITHALFPYLNPHQVTYPFGTQTPLHFCRTISDGFPRSFVHRWTDLERVVSEGEDPIWEVEDTEGGIEDLHLISLWSRVPSQRRKKIEYVLDFTSVRVPLKQRLWILEGRKTTSLASFFSTDFGLRVASEVVDLTVVLKVWTEDEREAKLEIAGLEGWLKALVRLELGGTRWGT